MENKTCSICGVTILNKYYSIQPEDNQPLSDISNLICPNCAENITETYCSVNDLKAVPAQALARLLKVKKELLKAQNKEEEIPQTVFDFKAVPIPSAIKSHLDEYIIGQDSVKKTLAVAVYNHYKRINSKNEDVDIQKSNILMLGPTGSGKTYIAQTLANLLNVPFAVTDATSLTEAGYVGEDVESILNTLLENANGDIEACERGIVYIDEIDKIARKSENASITRDVSGEGVQQALLKIIEETVVNIPATRGRRIPNAPTISINTKNILFICGGAFVGIDKVNTSTEKSLGFVHVPKAQEVKSNIFTDLSKYGLMPEFIGRLPVVCKLNELDINALCDILVKPKNSLTKQYQKLLSIDDVELNFEKDALEAIAQIAISQKIGARGLRSVLETVMSDIMFSLPDDPTIKNVTITKSHVEMFFQSKAA